MKRWRKWTSEEDQILLEKYAELGAQGLEAILGRNRFAIGNRAYKKGLRVGVERRRLINEAKKGGRVVGVPAKQRKESREKMVERPVEASVFTVRELREFREWLDSVPVGKAEDE